MTSWTTAYIVTPLIALLGAAITVGAFTRDFSIPFEYAHDSFLVTFPVKAIVENGWWYENDSLGAPGRSELYDYPSSPNLHFAIIKCMAIFDSNPFRLLNAYLLLSFPLVALFTLFAFRAMRLEVAPSVALSLIFAFAPYHYWRGMSHLWLGCYLTVPLAMLLIVWVLNNRANLIGSSEEGKWKWSLFTLPTLAAVAICAALGFDFPYYPVFACFFLLIVGPYMSLQQKSWTPTIRSSILIGGIAFFFVMNLMPNILHRLEHGKNMSPTIVTIRPWHDAERYGLKIAPMILPVQEHPIKPLRRIQQKYYAGTIAKSEDSSPALGTIAAAGFLFLIGWLLLRQNMGKTAHTDLLNWMSLLTISAILLCTVGGFSAVLNLVTIGALRGYNRVSIFIMLFSLVPIAIYWGWLGQHMTQTKFRRISYYTGLVLLTVLGTVEQRRYFRKTGPEEVAEFRSDNNFVDHIESDVGEHGMIFQLPVQNLFSYHGPAIAVDPYTHFRGYLHSSKIHWSFGAVVGRTTSDIHNYIDEQATEDRKSVV